jgi:hypothetical protein
VLAALGRPPGRLEPVRDRAAIVRFLIAPPGRLRRVDGLEEARALPGVELAYSYRAPGTQIEPLLRGSDRAGFVLATGDTRAEAEAAAREAEATISFLVD